MGGHSNGGYSTSVLGEQLLDELAGLLILAAGRWRLPGERYTPCAIKEKLRGKPIYIGIGENGKAHKPYAEKAVQIYKAWGADVTFEVWPGDRHGDVPSNTKMFDWLLANSSGQLSEVSSPDPTQPKAKSPIRDDVELTLADVPTVISAARKAEKVGELGTAFTMYWQVFKISQTDPACIAAAKAVEKLAQQAEKQLAESEKAMGKKPYPQVARQLDWIAKTYAGTAFAERALKQKRTLLNARADELEARARAAEDARNYTKAFQLYKLYLTYFSESDRYSEVKAHADALKANTGIQK